MGLSSWALGLVAMAGVLGYFTAGWTRPLREQTTLAGAEVRGVGVEEEEGLGGSRTDGRWRRRVAVVVRGC
jgi:hypothetical protein